MAGIPNATTDFLKITHYFSTPLARALSCATYWSSSPSTLAIDNTNIVTVASDFHDQFGDLWSDLADSVCSLTATRAQWYGVADDGYHAAYGNGAAVAGDKTIATASSDIGESDALPDWDALLITRNTDSRLRERRGRLFIPCLSEDFSKGGILQPEAFTAANALAAFVSNDQTAGPGTWHARHWNKKANTLHVVTQAKVMQTLTTRTDRKPRGLNLPTA